LNFDKSENIRINLSGLVSNWRKRRL